MILIFILIYMILCKARDLEKNDKVALLLQQQQQEDLKQLNKVTQICLTHVNGSLLELATKRRHIVLYFYLAWLYHGTSRTLSVK